MTGKLLISPPQSASASWQVQADEIAFEWQLAYPGTATITLLTGWDVYSDESDADSPIQLNAYVTYQENNVYLFRGTITNITRVIQDGVPGIILDCMDEMYALTHTLACYTGDDSVTRYTWRVQSPTQELTTQRLYQGWNYSSTIFQYTYYPKFDSSAWLGTGSSTSFTIIDDMDGTNADISELIVGSSSAGGYPGIPPAGFFSVTVGGSTEFCQYNGMQYDVAVDKWKLLNVKRVKLGSAQVDPAANATAYLRLSKRISPETRVRIEGVYSGDTNNTPIPDIHYEINNEDGSFVFGLDPNDLRPENDFDYLQASYAVYNEDGGSQVNLSDILADTLNIGRDYGAPNFAAGDRSITLSPDPVITHVQVKEPTIYSEFLRRILFELGLAKGTSADLIAPWFDSSDGKLHIETLSQSATPDRRYYGEHMRQEEFSLEDVKSAVLVRYQDGGNFNLIGGTRFWHQQSFTSATYPQVWIKTGGAWAIPTSLRPSAYNATYSDIIYKCVLTDNDSTTGFALDYDSTTYTTQNIDDDGDVLIYAWFPGASDTAPSYWYTKRIVAVFEMIGTIAQPIEISIRGITGFTDNGTSEPTATVVNISPSMTQMWGVGNDNYLATLNHSTYEIKDEDLHVPLQGICIYVKGLVDSSVGPTNYALKILDLYVEGYQEREELVRLVATYDSGETNAVLVAQDSYNKLVDSTTAQHHVQVLDIGPATRDVALYLGWLQLLQTLALAQTRVYKIDSDSLDREGIPIVGETISMSDGFSGLCDNIRYRVSGGGQRELEIRLIDYNTTLFGMDTT